jgi:SsrA-binding protein
MALVNNKKATFNYDVLDRFEGGISLLGHEVKSIKEGKMKLEGSYVILRGGEVFLVGASITPYQANNVPEEYEPERPRKILLNKKEIKKLEDQTKNAGLTLIPISLYNKGRNIKIEIAIARGKKKTDKRETIKKREADIEIERTLKNQR